MGLAHPTNNHIISWTQVLNLDDVDSAVSLNTQRVYEGIHQTIGTGSKGMNVRQGRSNGKGSVYGDVIVNSNTKPDIILAGVWTLKELWI